MRDTCPLPTPEKQPASMRKEAVEAAVKRTTGCCCTTDSTLPTTAPKPPAGNSKGVTLVLEGRVGRLLQPC